MPQPSPNQAARTQQQQQQAVTAMLLTGMAAAWSLIDVTNLAGSLPKYEAAVASLVYKFGQGSAAIAGRYYQQQRHTAGVTGRFVPKPATPPGLGQVQANLGWATKGMWTADPTPDVVGNAKTLSNGVAQKMVTGTGRNTLIEAIEADRKARGWAREASPDACSFCALLSTRGAVYRSETTASFEAHDHCHCIPVPLFADHYEPPAYIRAWQQLYQATPYGANAAEARNNFRVALERSRAGHAAQPVNA